MKIYIGLLSLFAVGGFNAMEEHKENAQPLLTVTQMAQKPLDEIQKAYPNAEKVLRAATIDDLHATVDILTKINAPKEDIVKTLEIMEREVYKEAHIPIQPEIKKNISHYVSSLFNDELHRIRIDGEESIQKFASYMKLLNFQSFYDEKYQDAVKVFQVDQWYLSFEEAYVSYNDNYSAIICIIDEEGYKKSLKVRSLFNSQEKNIVEKILRSGNANIAFDIAPEEEGSYNATFKNPDLEYANILKNRKLFF